MRIAVTCPACQSRLSALAAAIGNTIRCPDCRAALAITVQAVAVGSAPVPRGRDREPGKPPEGRVRGDAPVWRRKLGPVSAAMTVIATFIAALLLAAAFDSSGKRHRGLIPAEVVGTRVEPYRTAAGADTTMVYADWTNIGDRPVRAVYAAIKAFDARGVEVYAVPEYPVYAVFTDDPGVRPGDTYREPSGEGFVLPPDVGGRVVRATATITRVDEKGM